MTSNDKNIYRKPGTKITLAPHHSEILYIVKSGFRMSLLGAGTQVKDIKDNMFMVCDDQIKEVKGGDA